jgi:hypothetical protein
MFDAKWFFNLLNLIFILLLSFILSLESYRWKNNHSLLYWPSFCPQVLPWQIQPT